MILDLYGTNRHRGSWDDPGTFLPERFQDFEPGPYAFIPQGGGDYFQPHRCPGEWITIEQMKLAVDVLLNEMTYSVPPQDLRVELRKMAAIPNSGVILANIRAGTNGRERYPARACPRAGCGPAVRAA